MVMSLSSSVDTQLFIKVESQDHASLPLSCLGGQLLPARESNDQRETENCDLGSSSLKPTPLILHSTVSKEGEENRGRV